MVRYVDQVDGITPAMLTGFFENWPSPPSPEVHLHILRSSRYVQLAIDDECNHVAGFINAVSDGVMSAYIPLLEVLPAYRGQGIGSELARRMIEQLGHLYMVDVMCDADIVPFYQKLGMTAGTGAMLRNYARQSCEPI